MEGPLRCSHGVVKPDGVGHPVVDLGQGLEVGVADEGLEKVDVLVPGELLLSERLQSTTQLGKQLWRRPKKNVLTRHNRLQRSC